MSWRGEPLADVAYDPFAQAEIGRLEQLRLAALEDRIDADLALGRHAALVPELEALVATHPLRERFRAQLMVALYRAGRQAEALGVYRDARRALVDELGVEPGPELQRLEQAILAQDPGLTAPPAPFPSAPRSLDRRLLLLAVVAALVAAATAAFLLTRDDTAPTVVPNSVVEIDPDSNHIRNVEPVGDAPGAIATSGDQLWVANRGDDTLTHVDTSTDDMRTLGGFPFPTSLAAEGSRIWVGNNESGVLVAIDSETGREVDRVPIPGSAASYLAVGGGSIWVSEEELAIMRVAPATGRVTDRRLDSAHGVAYGRGAAWFLRTGPGELLRVDARDETQQVIRVGSLPEGVAVGLGAVWVASSRDRVVRRVNPTTGNVGAVITVGRRPLGVAVGGGAVWVANAGDGTVSRIDPRSNQVVETIRVGYVPVAVHVGAGGVWVAVQAQQ